MPYIQSLLPVEITFYKIKPHYCINIKEYVLNSRLYRKLNYKDTMHYNYKYYQIKRSLYFI
ncbi:hypothetical protein HMPREF9945_03291 [Clostridioides difficile 70-100-2010]|nr:hypothetical protein HMPREF9945_03291 [Clostridioides difficile 70-100-2010]